jgi:hypothetical protein
MASFLLDENISHVVVEQVLLKEPSSRIVSIKRWRLGLYTGVEDRIMLRAALEEGLTLVTYDLRTIKPLLKEWAEEGITHAGVVFIDDKSIAGNDFGSLIRSILSLWNAVKDHDLTNEVRFITRVDE